MNMILGSFCNSLYNPMRAKKHLYGYDDIIAIARDYTYGWQSMIRSAIHYADHITLLADNVSYPHPDAWNTSIELSMIVADKCQKKTTCRVGKRIVKMSNIPGINDFDHNAHVRLCDSNVEIATKWPDHWPDLTDLDACIKANKFIDAHVYSEYLISQRRQLHKDLSYKP